jgi:hypothetical protein
MIDSNKKWIVYFASGNYWTGGITGRHHILKRLSTDYNILFVNSLGLAGVGSIKKNTVLTRIKNKIKANLKYLRRDNEFYVFSPLNFQIGIRFVDALSIYFILLQLKLVFLLKGIKKPITWICNPKAVLLTNKYKSDKIIYNYSDKFSSYREISNKEYIQKLDDELKEKSDLIFCNLFKTYEELSLTEYKNKIHYFPHSVDFKFFNEYLIKEIEVPQDIKEISHPIIGYYGTLTDSNDWEIIKYCAEKKPDYSFVFIGEAREDIDKDIKKIPNVHFLGYKPYEELPKYLKFFDVCIMFWKVTDWIYNSSPLKTKEFFAMGKPIVSVKIYELQKNYPDTISFAETKEEFLEKIDYKLSTDNEERIKRRIGSVKNDTWEITAKKIKKIIEA